MKIVSTDEVNRQIVEGSWRTLEQRAAQINKQAEKVANSQLNPALGGGTRLMLALKHRLSDDVDIFIQSPQWINYLTPRLNDAIEEHVSDYHEGATSLKLHLPEGEIDYIVSAPLLGLPNERSELSHFDLEPIPEVLAKKLFYRGHAITARDLFDWRQIEMKVPPAELQVEKLVMVLGDKLNSIEKALNALSTVDEFVKSIAWESIRTPYPLDFDESIAWGLNRIEQLKRLSNQLSADSEVQLRGVLSELGYENIAPAKTDGVYSYSGQVVAVSSMHIAQDAGRRKIVIHDTRILNKVADVGERLDVQIKDGRGRVTTIAPLDRGLGR